MRGMLVDEAGRRLLKAGEHELKWDAGKLEKGVYFCRVKVGDELRVLKVVRR